MEWWDTRRGATPDPSGPMVALQLLLIAVGGGCIGLGLTAMIGRAYAFEAFEPGPPLAIGFVATAALLVIRLASRLPPS